MENTEENNKEKVEEVLLVSSLDDITISQICAILNDNNIPFVKVDEGSGAYMNVYMGFSNQGKNIIGSMILLDFLKIRMKKKKRKFLKLPLEYIAHIW